MTDDPGLTPSVSADETQQKPTIPSPLGVRVNPAPSNSSFWTRHKTVINFWLDAALLVLFLVIAWELSILRLAFPKGSGEHWRLLGHTAGDWQDLAFNTFCVFAAGIVVHVMLHWPWIVATIQTKLLRVKATRDDGSQTMIGVGLLIVIIHILAGGILWARWAITEVREV